MKSAESFYRRTAERLFRRSFTKTKMSAAPTCYSIRQIPTSLMRRFGKHDKGLGRTARGTGAAASLNQRTAVRPGHNWAAACLKELFKRTWRLRPACRIV